MFFVVVSCVCAWRAKYVFSAFLSGYQLPSFGFQENGKFRFVVKTAQSSTLSLFLATSSEIRSKVYRNVKFVSSCKDPTEHIAILNRTYRKEGRFFEWTGTITEKAVYWPYFVNCEQNVSNVEVSLEFSNPQSLIDYRDEYYSLLSLVFCFVYVLITLVWLVNWLMYSRFFIALHWAMCLIAVTKAVVMAGSSMKWEDARLGNEASIWRKFFNMSMTVTHYTLVLSVPLLVLSGWCTFIEHYDVTQMGSIIGSGFVLVFGIMTVGEISSVAEALVSMILVFFGVLWYLKNCIEVGGLVTRLMSLEIAPGSGLLKVKMVSSFGYTLIVLLVIVLSVCFTTLTFDMWPIVSSAMLEIGFVALQLVEMKFFLFRNGYSGDIVEEEDASINMRVIDDPNGKGYAILAHD